MLGVPPIVRGISERVEAEFIKYKRCPNFGFEIRVNLIEILGNKTLVGKIFSSCLVFS